AGHEPAANGDHGVHGLRQLDAVWGLKDDDTGRTDGRTAGDQKQVGRGKRADDLDVEGERAVDFAELEPKEGGLGLDIMIGGALKLVTEVVPLDIVTGRSSG
uniref:hypothetical protein n=1 Tax=Pandoraea sputorum TaxID=93222 RepID=UPI00355825EF